MSSFKSQNFFFREDFQLKKIITLGGWEGVRGGETFGNIFAPDLKREKNRSPRGLLPALLPGHKARYFEFKTKGGVIAGTIWLLQAVLCSDIECWRSLSLCALVSPSAEGGLWARLSLKASKAQRNLQLRSVPACLPVSIPSKQACSTERLFPPSS